MELVITASLVLASLGAIIGVILLVAPSVFIHLGKVFDRPMMSIEALREYLDGKVDIERIRELLDSSVSIEKLREVLDREYSIEKLREFLDVEISTEKFRQRMDRSINVDTQIYRLARLLGIFALLSSVILFASLMGRL
jgi:hypothetical protein